MLGVSPFIDLSIVSPKDGVAPKKHPREPASALWQDAGLPLSNDQALVDMSPTDSGH